MKYISCQTGLSVVTELCRCSFGLWSF